MTHEQVPCLALAIACVYRVYMGVHGKLEEHERSLAQTVLHNYSPIMSTSFDTN